MGDTINRNTTLEAISKMDFDFGDATDHTNAIITMVSEAISNQPSADHTREDQMIAVIERAKTLLAAYRDMYDRSETEDRFYGKTLPELSVFYDEAECDASCLYDDMGSLLDDIEDLGLHSEKIRMEVMR